MKKVKIMKTPKEKGQIIVMIAVGIIALVAFSALVLDGGMLYLTRREMQTAADSAAIAAASVFCEEKSSVNDAIATGEEYAITNGADSDGVDVHQITGSKFYASATKNVDTFFAGLIGYNQVDVFAEAAAVCGASVGIRLMPVAFACRDSVGNLVSENPDWDPTQYEECFTNSWTKEEIFGVGGYIAQYGPGILDYPVLETDPNYIPLFQKLYVMMDPVGTFDEYCDSDNPLSGYFNCDFDGDGVNDLLSAADRSWMDLNGDSPDAADLNDWISNGFFEPLRYHTWFPSDIGDKASAYHAAKPLEGTIVLLPVFDIFCPDDACVNEIMQQYPHSSIPDIVEDNSGLNGTYFHVITFVEFYVTCVVSTGGDTCPGMQAYKAIAGLNPTTQVNSIEGYLLSGYSDQVGGDIDISGAGTGTYNVYLVPVD